MLKKKTLEHLSSFLIDEIHKQKEIGLIDKMWRLVDISNGNYCGAELIQTDTTLACVFVEDVTKALNACILNNKEKIEAIKIIKELNLELEEK